jgi:hypothetical protein
MRRNQPSLYNFSTIQQHAGEQSEYPAAPAELSPQRSLCLSGEFRQQSFEETIAGVTLNQNFPMHGLQSAHRLLQWAAQTGRLHQ